MILSKYNNLVALGDGKSWVVYNSLSGNMLLINATARRNIFEGGEGLSKSDLTVLFKNKFAFRDLQEERNFGPKIETGLRQSRNGTVRISIPWPETITSDLFTSRIARNINRLCGSSKKVLVDYYIYSPFNGNSGKMFAR